MLQERRGNRWIIELCFWCNEEMSCPLSAKPTLSRSVSGEIWWKKLKHRISSHWEALEAQCDVQGLYESKRHWEHLHVFKQAGYCWLSVEKHTPLVYVTYYVIFLEGRSLFSLEQTNRETTKGQIFPISLFFTFWTLQYKCSASDYIGIFADCYVISWSIFTC